MSRVYDALQQCIPDQVPQITLPEGTSNALFSEQFANSIWDPNSAQTIELCLSSAERLPVLSAPYSFASEQFALLATRLQHLQQARPIKSVLLTSSLEGEGKSLLILNLALSLAKGGQNKVLVVDGELRKPGISQMLKPNNRAGLREWYRNNRHVKDLVYKIDDLNFWVLPPGQAAVDPLELLKSPRLPDLHSFLTASFDWVLIDSPSLLPLADAEIISRISDATILVVRRDKSCKAALKEALERIAPSKMVGLLLNEFPSTTRGYATNGAHSHL